MTPREPDRFDIDSLMRRGLSKDAAISLSRDITDRIRAAESSALERAAQIADQHESRLIANSIRALIPPAAAPKTQRDAPCGGCGHPLWWHQWNSKEHAFCCAPLDELQRDYCRCKNYEKPADAPAAEPRLDNLAAESPAPVAETGKEKGEIPVGNCGECGAPLGTSDDKMPDTPPEFLDSEFCWIQWRGGSHAKHIVAATPAPAQGEQARECMICHERPVANAPDAAACGVCMLADLRRIMSERDEAERKLAARAAPPEGEGT